MPTSESQSLAQRRTWRVGLSAFSYGPDVGGHKDARGEWVTDSGTGFAVYGPYSVFPAGGYRVSAEVRGIDGKPAAGTIDVFSGGEVLAQAALTSPVLEFTAKAGLPVEFRIRLDGDAVVFGGCVVQSLVVAGDADEDPERNQMMARADAIWNALHASPIEPETLAVLSKSDDSQALEAAALALSGLEPPDIVDAWSTDEAVVRRLTDMGLDAKAIERAASDTAEIEAELRNDLGLSPLRSSPSKSARPATGKGVPFPDLLAHDRSFQATLLEHGCLLCPCPWTGRTLASRHVFPVSLPAMKQTWLYYRFESQFPFYVQVSAWPGLKTALYLPGLNALIRISDPIYEWGFPHGGVQGLRSIVTPRASAVADYLSGETKTAVLSGTMNNLGHFFWNDAAGLLQAERAGRLRDVEHIVIAQYPFLNADDLLQGSRSIAHAETAQDLFDVVLGQRLICVRPTAVRITREDTARIRELAHTQSSPGLEEQISQAQQSTLLLWVNLRAHNKIWRGQAEGLAYIVGQLRNRWPSICVFLDGTPDCEDMAQRFIAALPAGVKTIPGFNLPIADSICWADAVDAYIATIGSGLTLTTWIADKPGIAHGDPGHLHQMSFWSDVLEGSRQPISPAVSEVKTYGTAMYSDYEVPKAVLRRLTGRLIEEIPAVRQVRVAKN